MADPALTRPAEVTIYASDLKNPRFTPRELRMIREGIGRTLSQILSDEESDEKFLVFGWLKLRRDGYDVAFTDMDDVLLAFQVEDRPVDPTNGRPSPSSPTSAAIGE